MEAREAAAEARDAAAEHEDALQALALRTAPLGADRHHRTYWWPLGTRRSQRPRTRAQAHELNLFTCDLDLVVWPAESGCRPTSGARSETPAGGRYPSSCQVVQPAEAAANRSAPPVSVIIPLAAGQAARPGVLRDERVRRSVLHL